MTANYTSTPLKPCLPVESTFYKNIQINEKKKKLQESLVWGACNLILLSIIVYDIKHTCPFHKSTLQYVEYAAAVILSLNIIHYIIRYFKIYFTLETLSSTSNQNNTIGVRSPDGNYKTSSNPSSPTPFLSSPVVRSPSQSFNVTPMNMSALSWRSQTDSMNLSVQSTSWHYNQGSPVFLNQSLTTPPKLPLRDTSGVDVIRDEASLQKYLEDFDKNEKEANQRNAKSPDQSTNWLSSYWNYPMSKNSMDVSPYLRKTEYQLSPQMSTATTSAKSDDKSSPLNQSNKGIEPWRKLQVDPRVLTQWNENLRKWISQTILERLVREINNIDTAFQLHGLTDLTLGQVGLDRLRKTAQMAPVIQYIPTLSALIPFLELTPNQEYLVKRIKELSKGGCMSEFKWNGGSNFHGKEWDTSLPSDSSIIMHLFASYMDTQLMPAPNKPDAKPFSTFHYIRFTEKAPDLIQYSMAIQEACVNPPHFKVLIGSEPFDLVKGYNNLFHSILLFLYHVNEKEHGMLGRVNLGKAGINMLWIINS